MAFIQKLGGCAQWPFSSGLLVIFASASFYFTSCQEKSQAKIPAWLQIDSVGMITNYLAQGTAYQNFKDVWVYVDGNLLGGFELPFLIPVLTFGKVPLLLRPGIFVNGFSGLRAQYSAVRLLSLTRTFKADSVTTVFPVFSYDSLITFPFLEDFESAGIQFTFSPGSAVGMVRLSGPGVGYFSNSCGHIVLSSGSALTGQAETVNAIFLPKGGRPKFMELHYRCNTPVDVLLICLSSSGLRTEKYIASLKSTNNQWNKAYFTLTPFTDAFLEGNQFKPAFRISRENEHSSVYLDVDNVKVLY